MKKRLVSFLLSKYFNPILVIGIPTVIGYCLGQAFDERQLYAVIGALVGTLTLLAGTVIILND